MLTEYNGFKLGDRVHWPGDNSSYYESDSGTISTHNGEVFFECNEGGGGKVWVKWDSNGAYQYISVESIQHEQPKQSNILTNEQEAVMLLLSLGYTVSKNQK